MNPFRLFELIVEFGAAMIGGLLALVAFTIFCVFIITEIRDCL